MSSAPFDLVCSRLDSLECRPVHSGSGVSARCPAHEDRRASLSVAEGHGGRALVKCHTGCALPDILAALELEESDLFVREEKSAPRRKADLGPVVATYPYTDETGKVLYEATRHEPKDFRQRRPDGKGGWIPGLDGVRRVLFRLPQVVVAVAEGKAIFVTEGEKDALSLVSLGLSATCNPMGAGKWKDDFSAHLAGADVVVVADKDDAGRKHAQAVALSLHGRAASVRIIEVTTGKDASDWIAAGATREDFERLAAAVPAWEPGIRPVDSSEEPKVIYEWIPPPPPRPRPTLPEAALHGLAGRWVRAVAPHTEGDPLGILGAFLTRFGIAVGRGPHYRIGGTRHGTNLFICLVGPTSTGRKQTADAEAARGFRIAERVPPTASGLSSGEGLIAAVRDKLVVMRPVKEKGRVVSHEEVVEDEGVSDKRLLVVESELGSVLKRMERDGNSLSPVIRQAWDGETLRTLIRKSAIATDPHIGIVASITPSELQSLLAETEVLNGWGNRFLWLDVLRPHLVPGGGDLRDSELIPLACELRDAVERGTTMDEIQMDAPTAERWQKRLYPALTADRPGAFGSMTTRAAPQVLRLSLVYAVIDGSPEIRQEHLRAGLAFWQAAEESARGLFGDQLGDKVAETIISELREAGTDGLTRTEMFALFGRNIPLSRIKVALDLLARQRLAVGRKETPAAPSGKRGGRPAERWFEISLVHETNESHERTPRGHGAERGVSSSTSFHSSVEEKTGEGGGGVSSSTSSTSSTSSAAEKTSTGEAGR